MRASVGVWPWPEKKCVSGLGGSKLSIFVHKSYTNSPKWLRRAMTCTFRNENDVNELCWVHFNWTVRLIVSIMKLHNYAGCHHNATIALYSVDKHHNELWAPRNLEKPAENGSFHITADWLRLLQKCVSLRFSGVKQKLPSINGTPNGQFYFKSS